MGWRSFWKICSSIRRLRAVTSGRKHGQSVWRAFPVSYALFFATEHDASRGTQFTHQTKSKTARGAQFKNALRETPLVKSYVACVKEDKMQLGACVAALGARFDWKLEGARRYFEDKAFGNAQK